MNKKENFSVKFLKATTQLLSTIFSKLRKNQHQLRKVSYFYFKDLNSPTQFNLSKYLLKAGFKKAEATEAAQFSDKNLVLDEGAKILEEKDRLAQLSQQYFPEMMPLTYAINDNNYQEVLESIRTDQKQSNTIWILKPALLNNGKGIKLFNKLVDIEQYYKGTKRYGGPHVLQQYIQYPHLLRSHKYSFRQFCLISNFAGSYLYREGYTNVSREPYPFDNINNLHAHLTNEHLNPDHSLNTHQIPTTHYPNFEPVYQKIYQIVHSVLKSLKKEYPAIFTSEKKEGCAFSLFGFDFMLDDHGKLWLLEINHGPCFPKSDEHILQKHLYHQFWTSIVTTFIEPMVNNRSPQIKSSTLWQKIEN